MDFNLGILQNLFRWYGYCVQNGFKYFPSYYVNLLNYLIGYIIVYPYTKLWAFSLNTFNELYLFKILNSD